MINWRKNIGTLNEINLIQSVLHNDLLDSYEFQTFEGNFILKTLSQNDVSYSQDSLFLFRNGHQMNKKINIYNFLIKHNEIDSTKSKDTQIINKNIIKYLVEFDSLKIKNNICGSVMLRTLENINFGNNLSSSPLH
ncbi:MAG: hypothetical protein K8S23_05610 [Candidatus Cloacimonetes bacterium]|nr:hypothetical protein [Candidatus Cloacimonadota bacterium]